ncbi:hypothetical protein [Arthrobacter sp. NPDC092385]|uniref:hypothetical protein n=1 Tax=Arthrobacter sp. NPDC092385 TaxID=3363943 RepID=UPI00380DEC0F
MANGTIGANIDALRDLSSSFGQAQQQLSGIALLITSRVNAPGYWNGADADRFRATWNSDHRPRILAAESLLTTGATSLRADADEQEAASEQGSGAIPGGVPGAGPSGPPRGEGGSAGRPAGLLDELFGGLLGGAAGIFAGYSAADSWLSRASLPVTALRLFNHLELAGSFSGLDDALRASSQGAQLQRIAGIFGGEGWGAELQRLGGVLPEGFSGRVGSLAEPLGAFGKAVGPIGVGLGLVTVGQDVAEGNYDRAAYHFATTALGGAALITPPPVNLALGLASGGLALGELAYDNIPVFHDAVDWSVGAVGDGIGAVTEGVKDLGAGIAEKAEDLWPF